LGMFGRSNFKMKLLLFSFFLFLVGTASCKELFSRSASSLSRSAEPCCDKDTLSCYDVDVDPESLLSEENISINGMELEFSNTIAPHGRVYKTEQGDEAVISLNEETGNIFGTLKTNEGKSFALEKCQNGYIFEEFDVHAFLEEEGELDGNFARALSPNSTNSTWYNRNEIVTYTVMFYYTPEFAAATPNVGDFTDQVIAETNEGYENSQIPVRIQKFCTEQATVNEDDTSSSVILTAFRNMKGSLEELRNTADSAVLLTNDLSSCGRGYLHTYASGLTVSVTKKSCALGYYTFGHEIGHNFGATHDPDTSTNSRFDYGHGHHILPTGGSKWSGYRTIMAYFVDGHYNRVNYYSNPNVNYPGTGTPTGVADLSDNARVFVENRYSFAGLGDESAVCNDGSSPSTTTTTTAPSTTSAPSLGGCNEGQMPTFLTIKKKRNVATWTECRDMCDANSECEYFQWKDNKSAKKRQCFLRKVGFKNKNGFVSGEKFCGLSNTRKISSRSVECNENQMLTFLTVAKAKKPTWSECRDLCDGNPDCEFFQWKDHKSAKRRLCLLRKVGFKNKKGFVSGEKFCGSSM